MKTERLRAFIAIVDAGSVTRAADQLRIAQPALSQQIVALEASFGTPLLIRSRQGVVPTPAGHALYRHAQIILRQLDQAQLDVNAASHDISGRVSIGLPAAIACMLALPLLEATRDAHPAVQLHLDSSPSGHLLERLQHARLDMAVLYGDEPVKGLDRQPLARERLVLLSGPAHEDLASDAGVAVAALHDLPLLLPSKPNGLRVTVDAAFSQAGTTPTIVAELDHLPSLIAAVEAGIGCTIAAPSTSTLARGPLRLTSLVDPAIERVLTLCVSSNVPTTPAVDAIRALLVKQVDELADAGEWRGLSALSPPAIARPYVARR